jgi:hypothetical protein
VLITSDVPLFTPANAKMFPAPGEESPAPIVVLLEVQLYIVEGSLPIKVMVDVNVPAQTTWSDGSTTVDTGKIVKSNVCGVPAQLELLVGVTVTVALIVVVNVFCAVKEGIVFPIPFDKPIFKLAGVTVQEKVVPAKFDVNETACVDVYAHNV